MHVAEAANVHQDVEAEVLPGAEGARNLVVTAAMLQAQLDQLPALRFGKSFHDVANLAVRMMRVLVEQRGSKLDFERLIVQQINQRRGLDGNPCEKFSGGGGQLAASLDLVGS